MPFGAFLRRLATNLPFGVSVGVVAGLLDEDGAEQMAALSRHGHAVWLVYLGHELPVAVNERIAVTLLPEVSFEDLGAPKSEPSLLVASEGDAVTPSPQPSRRGRGR